MAEASRDVAVSGDAVDEADGPATPAIAVRLSGWLILAVMTAFLIDAILTFWGDWPGAGALTGIGAGSNSDGSTALMTIQAGIYVALAALAAVYVLRTRDTALRTDAKLVSDANRFLIRSAFWVVFLVGLTDAALSFLRVEGLLEVLVGEEMTRDLGRSAYRGLYVHTPVVVLGIVIGALTRSLGVIWLTLLVVVAELLIVFTRFVFSYEQAFMADLVRFWYGALFLFASAFTLLEDGHVRVDVFYSGFKRRTKGLVNSWGAVLLGMSLCWTILIFGMWTKSSVIISPLLVFEVTQAGFGMYVKYFMAGFLGVFAVSMMIQFVSQMFDAAADARGDPGGKVPTDGVPTH
ncbi:MAG: TRAP transporter small permease subunit [Pseudomonadota bacterium]